MRKKHAVVRIPLCPKIQDAYIFMYESLNDLYISVHSQLCVCGTILISISQNIRRTGSITVTAVVVVVVVASGSTVLCSISQYCLNRELPMNRRTQHTLSVKKNSSSSVVYYCFVLQ